MHVSTECARECACMRRTPLRMRGHYNLLPAPRQNYELFIRVHARQPYVCAHARANIPPLISEQINGYNIDH